MGVGDIMGTEFGHTRPQASILSPLLASNKLQHRSLLATSELVDECFIGHAKDECFNHVRIHGIRKLIALLGKSGGVLA